MSSWVYVMGILLYCQGIVRQTSAEWAKNIYLMISILINDNASLIRGEVILALRQQGIDSRPFFIPMHELPPNNKDGEYFSGTKDISQRGINLLSYPSLTEFDIEFICKRLCYLMK